MARTVGKAGPRTQARGGAAVVPIDLPGVKAEEYQGKADSREALIESIESATATIDFKYPVKIKIEHDAGVMDCYAVFWIWMRHISMHLKESWPDAYAKLDHKGEMMHDMVCQMFLGTTKSAKIGKTILAGRQKTLTSPRMSKGELIDLLRRIEEWAVSIGITLPQPRSEYTQHKGLE